MTVRVNDGTAIRDVCPTKLRQTFSDTDLVPLAQLLILSIRTAPTTVPNFLNHFQPPTFLRRRGCHFSTLIHSLCYYTQREFFLTRFVA
jgi:hypothetical protein